MVTAQESAVSGSKNLAKLIEAIEQQVLSSPYDHDGYKWASRPRDWYCKKLAFSSRTFGNLIMKAPIDVLVMMVDGKKTPLLRVKQPGDLMTITHCQRVLKKIWQAEIGPFNERKAAHDADIAAQHDLNVKYYTKQIELLCKSGPPDKSKLHGLQTELKQSTQLRDRHLEKSKKAAMDANKPRAVTAKEYGCLRGLVMEWGVNNAPEFFTMVIRNWSDFMAGAKLQIAEGHAKGEKKLYERYFEFPTITFMLRFKEVALEMKVMHVQANFPALVKKKIDPGLPPLEQQKQEALLYKKIMDDLKPVVSPVQAG